MNQPTTAAPPGEPRRIADIDQLALLFPGWRGRFEQLSRGRFEGTLRVARGRAMYAHRVAANQSLHVRGREVPGVLGIALVLPATAGCLWQGRRLDPGRVVFRGGDVEADHLTSRPVVNVQLSMREDLLRRAAADETGDDPGPMGWRAVFPPPAAFARLEAAVRRFVDTPRADPDDDEVERACLAAAVAALVPPGGYRHDGLPLAARSRLIRRAEAALRDRLRDPITEADLCRDLGVPGRTLRLAFRERFGMGPMAYQQTLRLNAVRSTLKGPGRGDMSVAEVARAFGFDHPGKFAGYYRRLFGERPSETAGRGCCPAGARVR